MKTFLTFLCLVLCTALPAQEGVIFAVRDSFCVNLGDATIGNVTLNDDNPSGVQLTPFLLEQSSCFRLDAMGNLSFVPDAENCCGEHLLHYTYEGCQEPQFCTAEIKIIVKCPKPDCSYVDLGSYVDQNGDSDNPGEGEDIECLTTCEEAQSIYYVSYNTNFTYSWAVSGGNFIAGSNDAEIIVDWGIAGSGQITLTITNADNETSTTNICVDILEGPTAAFTPSSTTVCLGSDVYFTNNSTDANSWFWDFSDGNTSTQFEPSHSYSLPGTYKVILTATQDNYGPNGEPLCCCSDTISIDIIVDPLPGPSIYCISTLCSGDTSKYWTDATNCTDYTWTVLDANDVAIPFDGQGNDTICVVWGDGPYGQLILDVSDCDEAYCSQPTMAIVPIISSIANLSGPIEVCENEVAIYRAPKWPGVDYNWQITGGTLLSGQGTHVIVIQWGTAPGPGTIALNYASEFLSGLPGQDPADCTGTANLSVAIAPAFEVFGPRLVCVGTSSSYFATSSPSAAYTWSISPLIAFSGQGTNVINVDWTNGTGVYTITATPDDPTAYCNDEIVLSVSVVDVPKPVGIDGAVEICPGGSNTYFGIPSLAGTGFLWSVTGGTPTFFFGDPITINWNASGPYQIQLQQQGLSAPFCLSEPFVLDLIPKELAGPLAISGPAGCTNTVQSYSATPPQHPETDFVWSISPASAGSIISGQGTPNVMVQWNNTAGPASLDLNISLCDETDSESLVVNLTAAPPPTIVQVGILCPNGSATLDAGAGYSAYAWSTGPTTQTINISTGGNFVVTVTDGNGCQAVDTYQAVALNGPVASITTADVTELCSNPPNNTSSVTINAITGVGYTFAWYCNNILQALPSGQSFFIHNNTQVVGNFEYYVIVTGADGCSRQSNSIFVSQEVCTGGGPGDNCDGEDYSFSFTAVNQTPFCNVVNFTVSNSANVTLGSWLFNDPGDNSNTGTLSNAVHTYQQVGCRLVRLSGSVPNLNPPPASCIVYASEVVCVPLAADFSYSIDCQTVSFCELSTFLAGEGPTSYAWDFGDSNTSTLAKPTHTYTSTGIFTVSLIVTNDNGCQAIWTEDISVEGIPVPSTLMANPSPACVGEPVNFTTTGSGIISWLWDFGDGATNGSQNPSHTYTSDGTYNVSLSIVDEFGCTNTIILPLTVFPPVPEDVITWTPALEVCANELLVLTAPLGVGYTYLWSTGATTDTIHPATTGSYGVTVMDANGCSLIPDPVDVLIYPVPPAFINGPDVICDAGCITLDAPLGVGYTYQWFNNGGTPMPSQTAASLLVCDTDLASPYLVEVTNANGCTTLSSPFAVSMAISPVFTVDVAPDPCEGSLSTLTVNPIQADVVYSWNTGETATSIDVLQAGQYTVIGRDTLTGCSTVGTATIHPLPDLCLVPVGCYESCNPDTICGPAGLAAYQWNLDGDPIVGATDPCLIVTESGTYSLTGTTDFGCSLTTDSLMLTVINCEGCEDLSSFVTEEEECCWAISYQNDYDGDLYGIQLTMNDAVITYNPASVSPAMMVVSATDHSIGLTTIDGSPLQSGIAEEYLIFCLSEVETFPQQLIIDWYDFEFAVVCSDTLLLDCPIEPDCLYLQADSIYCQDSEVFYDMTICNPLDADFPLGFVDIQVFAPTGLTLVPPYFDITTNPIAPGDCRTFSILLNNAADFAGDDFCFNLIGHSESPLIIDTALCCSLDTMYCVPIPDCNPCDDIGIAFADELDTSLGDCCYSIGIFNDYQADFFDGISLCMLTPGVEMTMNNPFGSDWITTNFSSTVIELMASAMIDGSIPLGTISLPVICLDTETEAEQLLEIKWLMGGEIVCRDTLKLACDPPCGYILDEVVECNSTGGWLYSGSIQNTSDYTMGEAHIVFTAPVGLSGFNATIPLGALAPGSSFPFSIPIGAPANAGDEVCFTVALHEVNDEESHTNCCNFSDCIILPECDTTTDCLCDDNFFAQVDLGINALPPVGNSYSFQPQGDLTDCDLVRWVLTGGNGVFPIMQAIGNELVTFTISNPGSYQLCMRVRRTATDGSICNRIICILFQVDASSSPSVGYEMFPNPAVEEVTLEAKTFWPSQTEIKLMDVFGKVVKTLNTGTDIVTTRKILPLDQLPPGIYWLSLTVDGTTETKKLIIQ